ncbi:translation initiation factor eIF-1A [Thermoplasmatales archaeon ex4484_30]|nr:MAG: translation initiation factor eIF-1A [Thermoplasmatales archaeon ex4484_30]
MLDTVNVKDEEKEQEYLRIPLPNREKGEMFAVVDQLMGASRIKVVCEDGKARMARIPGRIKKRKWIRNRNLLIVKPWSFQDEKADVIYRYTPTQTANLARRNMIPENINIF